MSISEETRNKLSRAKKGNKYAQGNRSDASKKRISEGHIKRYSRIVKKGKNRHGNQQYALVCGGVVLQKSTNIDKLKKHPIYNRTIDLSKYKCFDCIYYVISKKCSVYEICKFAPQSCIMFNFGQKICRSIS